MRRKGVGCWELGVVEGKGKANGVEKSASQAHRVTNSKTFLTNFSLNIKDSPYFFTTPYTLHPTPSFIHPSSLHFAALSGVVVVTGMFGIGYVGRIWRTTALTGR